jgi:uncharacterized protein
MTWTLVVAVTCVAIVTLAWVVQRSLIYFPFGDVPSPSEVGLAGVEPVTFDTDDGIRLHGWFVPSRRSPAITLAVFNGNGGNRAYRSGLARAFGERGVAVLLFDYRGYGGNDGRPTEAGLASDARAARAYLAARADVDMRRVIYFGESLGAAVAIRLAVDHPPAALVLRSPFTSMADVGRVHYPFLPVRWLLRDRFPSLERIAQVSSPVLVIAGDRDRVVPIEQSRQLYAAASAPKRLVIISGADHNDEALAEGPEVIQATLQLLQPY